MWGVLMLVVLSVVCTEVCASNTYSSSSHWYIWPHIQFLGWVTLFWPSGVVTKYEELVEKQKVQWLASTCPQVAVTHNLPHSALIGVLHVSHIVLLPFVIFYCTTYFMFLIFGLSWSGVVMRVHVLLPMSLWDPNLSFSGVVRYSNKANNLSLL